MSSYGRAAYDLRPPLLIGQIAIRKSLTNLTSKSAVRAKLQDMLAIARATHVFESADAVWFQAGIRPVINTNILYSLALGRIEVDEGIDSFILKYRASAFQMTAICLCGAMFLASMPLVGDLRLGIFPTRAISVFIGFSSFLFGGNYLVTMFRLPRWLRNGLEQVISVKTSTERQDAN